MASSVAVVVLGDVGRSPRMQYHCLSLAALPDTSVSLVGYHGEKCVPDVESNPRIRKHLISAPFAKAPRALFLLWAPLKVLFQVLQLLWTLVVVIPRPRAFLVQNPPTIPTLFVVWLAARVRGARFIIDWHNFGYTVLGMTLGAAHPLVRVSTWYERFFARSADGHLSVTNAMRLWLDHHWGVRATVLYDKAPPFFKPTPPEQQHDLFMRLASSLPADLSAWNAQRAGGGGAAVAAAVARLPLDEPGVEAELPASLQRMERAGGGTGLRSAAPAHAARGGGGSGAAPARDPSGPTSSILERTLFTYKGSDGVVVLRPDRPALLVSSTSWTEDEDFNLLLAALVDVDAHAVAHAQDFPDVLVLVTGKGPLRAHYEAKMSALHLRRVHIRTAWLSPGDYPLLLGCADLGVSLHVSTSGLDLPMKVVDLFGAGTPACAVNFACLSELVRHDVNGLIFDTAPQLAAQLESLFQGFPGHPSARLLGRLRVGVREGTTARWGDNWTAHAADLFRA